MPDSSKSKASLANLNKLETQANRLAHDLDPTQQNTTANAATERENNGTGPLTIAAEAAQKHLEAVNTEFNKTLEALQAARAQYQKDVDHEQAAASATQARSKRAESGKVLDMKDPEDFVQYLRERVALDEISEKDEDKLYQIWKDNREKENDRAVQAAKDKAQAEKDRATAAQQAVTNQNTQTTLSQAQTGVNQAGVRLDQNQQGLNQAASQSAAALSQTATTSAMTNALNQAKYADEAGNSAVTRGIAGQQQAQKTAAMAAWGSGGSKEQMLAAAAAAKGDEWEQLYAAGSKRFLSSIPGYKQPETSTTAVAATPTTQADLARSAGQTPTSPQAADRMPPVPAVAPVAASTSGTGPDTQGAGYTGGLPEDPNKPKPV
jgi:hypothetical protein